MGEGQAEFWHRGLNVVLKEQVLGTTRRTNRGHKKSWVNKDQSLLKKKRMGQALEDRRSTCSMWCTITTTKHQIDVGTIGAGSAKTGTYRHFPHLHGLKSQKTTPLNNYRCRF